MPNCLIIIKKYLMVLNVGLVLIVHKMYLFILILGMQTAFVRFTHKFRFSCVYADESITVYLIIVSKKLFLKLMISVCVFK